MFPHIDRTFALVQAALNSPPKPTPEYTEALHLLQGAPDTENMDTRDGYVLVIPVTSAADLIADNYDKRVL